MNSATLRWLRLGGFLLGAAGGYFLAERLVGLLPSFLNNWSADFGWLESLLLIAGVIVGGLIGRNMLVGAIEAIQSQLKEAKGENFFGIMVGLILGLLAGALLSVPLRALPSPLGQWLPIIATAVCAYIGASAIGSRPNDLASFRTSIAPNASAPAQSSTDETQSAQQIDRAILMDTSVIIDGRITDVSKTGFVGSKLVVPNFVLLELQNIADSADPVRRKRGRRGLEVLNVLRTECPIPFEITDMDVSEVRDVDSKLVALARHLDYSIMTNDYNLNRVAGLQGVTVLNINDLANAVKAAFLPGEELDVKIIQEGREFGQGVGYLDDGTMVVIEDGSDRINEAMPVVVTKVLQTSAGRMIFARIP